MGLVLPEAACSKESKKHAEQGRATDFDRQNTERCIAQHHLLLGSLSNKRGGAERDNKRGRVRRRKQRGERETEKPEKERQARWTERTKGRQKSTIKRYSDRATAMPGNFVLFTVVYKSKWQGRKQAAGVA